MTPAPPIPPQLRTPDGLQAPPQPERLLGALPHLPALALEAPHTLLPPLRGAKAQPSQFIAVSSPSTLPPREEQRTPPQRQRQRRGPRHRRRARGPPARGARREGLRGEEGRGGRALARNGGGAPPRHAAPTQTLPQDPGGHSPERAAPGRDPAPAPGGGWGRPGAPRGGGGGAW